MCFDNVEIAMEHSLAGMTGGCGMHGMEQDGAVPRLADCAAGNGELERPGGFTVS